MKISPEAHKYLRIYCALTGKKNDEGLDALILETSRKNPEMFVPNFDKKE
jgi:hypothetical protein